MVDAPQSPYSTISKSGFAAHHRFTWHFLADWVLKIKIRTSTFTYYLRVLYTKFSKKNAAGRASHPAGPRGTGS
jgi:hypothetical protein